MKKVDYNIVLDLSRRDLDNIVNKINKRLSSLATNLGKDSAEYVAMARMIMTGLPQITTITDDSIKTNYIYRFKDDHATMILSRSYGKWNQFAEKYGTKAVKDFLNKLLNVPTYVEVSNTLPDKFSEIFGIDNKDMSVKEMSEHITDYNRVIDRAMQIIYALLGLSEDDEQYDFKSDLFDKADQLVKDARRQGEMTDAEKRAFFDSVIEFDKLVTQYDISQIGLTSDVLNASNKYQNYRRSALNKLERKQHSYELKWIEEQQGNYKITVPMDRDALERDINLLRSSKSERELPTSTISEILRRWSGFYG